VSKYRKLKTKFTSRVHLREALQATGLPFEEARPGQALTLNGYGGQRREATFVVRKRALGARYGDFGWQWDPATKGFTQIEDDLDAGHLPVQQNLQAIKREYAYAATVTQARVKGYQIRRIDLPSGEIQIQVTGRI